MCLLYLSDFSKTVGIFQIITLSVGDILYLNFGRKYIYYIYSKRIICKILFSKIKKKMGKKLKTQITLIILAMRCRLPGDNLEWNYDIVLLNLAFTDTTQIVLLFG